MITKLTRIIVALSLLQQGHHGHSMQRADEAYTHARRVAEHLQIPDTAGQAEVLPEWQSVLTPSAHQGLVGHSSGGHIVIDVIGNNSPSITRPANFRHLDLETGAQAVLQQPEKVVRFADTSGLNQRTSQVSGVDRGTASQTSHMRAMVDPRIQNRGQSTTVVQPISQIAEAQVWRALAIFVLFISMIIPFNMFMGQMASDT